VQQEEQEQGGVHVTCPHCGLLGAEAWVGWWVGHKNREAGEAVLYSSHRKQLFKFHVSELCTQHHSWPRIGSPAGQGAVVGTRELGGHNPPYRLAAGCVPCRQHQQRNTRPSNPLPRLTGYVQPCPGCQSSLGRRRQRRCSTGRRFQVRGYARVVAGGEP